MHYNYIHRPYMHYIAIYLLTGLLIYLVFGRPFVKRFALCYVFPVCLSLLFCIVGLLLYCGQTVGWITMSLGIEV